MSDVEVRGLRKSFGRTEVLRGVDLAVPAGELLAVLGPSGCGKTTLLRVIAGFERVDGGEVRIAGEVVAAPGRHVAAHRRRVAVVPQEGALFPHLTVSANIGFGLDRSARRGGGRVADLLRMAGLEGLGDRMPHEISGGQQQRVAVARAIAPDPAVVLLDEPFNGLDAGLRAALRDDVRRLLREAGSTAVLVTHDQEEALSVADRVAVMREGRILQAGSPVDVYERPADLATARFLGEANVLDGTASDGTVQCALGRLPLAEPAATGGVHVLVRPERVTIGRTGARGTVVRRRYHGHDALLTVRLDAGPDVLVRVGAGDGAAEGTVVRLAVPGPVVCYPYG